MYSGNYNSTGTEGYDNNWIDTILARVFLDEDIPLNIKDVFDRINSFYFMFKNEFKKQIKEWFVPFIKRYRMDRLIGKREKRIGLKR